MTTCERAIRYADQHRAIHVAWLDYWQANPPTTRAEREKRKHVGGITQQRFYIRRYDTILRALREAA